MGMLKVKEDRTERPNNERGVFDTLRWGKEGETVAPSYLILTEQQTPNVDLSSYHISFNCILITQIVRPRLSDGAPSYSCFHTAPSFRNCRMCWVLIYVPAAHADLKYSN